MFFFWGLLSLFLANFLNNLSIKISFFFIYFQKKKKKTGVGMSPQCTGSAIREGQGMFSAFLVVVLSLSMKPTLAVRFYLSLVPFPAPHGLNTICLVSS